MASEINAVWWTSQLLSLNVSPTNLLQVEDDNSTISITASKEADLKLEMIRLYRGVMFGDDKISSTDVIPVASASTEAETENMIRSIYRETICPMIYVDYNKIHQNFLFMVREIFGLDLSTSMTWNLCNTESTSGSQSLQLKFLNGISTSVSTGMIIKGNEQKPFLVALVDEVSGQIVTTGAEAVMEVEIVVLEGDSNNDEVENWTSDEFNNRIVKKWNGQKVLKGSTFVKLNEGTVFLDKISFTHNSGWKGKRNCRMGARSVSAGFPAHIKEAKTELFLVTDKRTSLYEKREIPSLCDPLYRLHMFSRRADYFKTLKKEGIKTVMDLLTFHAINPQRLKDILDVRPKQYKIIMDHAKVCKNDKGIYLYHYPRDGQTSNGVAFNISGQLVGIIADSHFVPCNKLPKEKTADAQKVIVSSTDRWDLVVPFKDQDSLIKHLQRRTTLKPLSDNNRYVVIPHTFDPHNHPNLTSPKSQSTKHPASDHAISNSPKKLRYDHPTLSPSMPSVGMDTSMRGEANRMESKPDDDDISMYLNLRDRWKIVWCAVGWISVILKLRKE